jgi:hypothetical protein
MSSLFVRPARPDDREAIDDLLARSYPPLLAPGYDAELLTTVLRR